MSWLSDNFRNFMDPANIVPDEYYGPLFDPGNVFGDNDRNAEDESGGLDSDDPLMNTPATFQMGLFKSMSDFRLRRSMGIGGSRGGSRVVNPVGSNPDGAPAAGITGPLLPTSPVSNMSVATSPESDIDSVRNFNYVGYNPSSQHGEARTGDPSNLGLTPEIHPFLRRMITPDTQDAFLERELARDPGSNSILWV